MKLIDAQDIEEKSKTKKNSCYRYHGIAYRVSNGEVTHFADSGQVLKVSHGFNVVVSTYDYSISSDIIGQAILRKLTNN